MAMKPTTLQRKFVEYVEQNHLLNDVRTVVAAVSGGVDSMCLLDLLMSEKKRWDIEIVVAHFNHQIRGPEADSDENLVRQFCDNHSLPFFSAAENVPKIARISILYQEVFPEDRYSEECIIQFCASKAGSSQVLVSSQRVLRNFLD